MYAVGWGHNVLTTKSRILPVWQYVVNMCEYVQTTYDLQDARELCGVGWGGVGCGVITSSRPHPWYYIDNMLSWSSYYVDNMLSLSSYYVDNMLKYLDTTSTTCFHDLQTSSYYADNMLKYLDTTSWRVLKKMASQAVEYEETVQWTCSGQSSPRGEGMAMAMASQQKCEYIIPHWLRNRCAKTLDGCASGVPEVSKWRCGPQAVGHGVTWVVFHSLFTRDLIAIKNSLSCLNSCLSLNVSIKTSISPFDERLFGWCWIKRLVLAFRFWRKVFVFWCC